MKRSSFHEMDPAVSAGELACQLPPCLASLGRDCRDHPGCLRDTGFACLCRARRLASAGRHLWLPAWRSGLRPAWFFTSACDRTHFRHFADDCGNGGGNGRRRRATIRADCEPRCLYRGGAQLACLAVAAERAGEADQRQHPRGLQGRRRIDHRHDPAAKPVRREGRRPQFFRARVSAGRAARSDAVPRSRRRRHRDRADRIRRALAAGKTGCAWGCHAGDHCRYPVGASCAWGANNRRDSGGLTHPGRPELSDYATSRE